MTNQQAKIIFIMICAVLFAVVFNQMKWAAFEHKNEALALSVFIEEGFPPGQYMEGIDLKKPVKMYELRKGQEVIQYQVPCVDQGNFYGLEGSSPSELGINENGFDSCMGATVKRQLRVYIVTKDMSVLSSYAAPISDNWSTPEDETQTKGSKLQLFSTCKPCFKRSN
jgi:hypothetical protein